MRRTMNEMLPDFKANAYHSFSPQQPDSARKERVWNDLVTVYSPQPPSLYPQERQDLHLPSWT